MQSLSKPIMEEFLKYFFNEKFDYVKKNAASLADFLSDEDLFDSPEKYYQFALAAAENSSNLENIDFKKLTADEQYEISCVAADDYISTENFSKE